jgi:maleate isomerase
MLGAASLLADARVSVICWTGTSAGWMGLERDRALCAAITERTGIPATSSVLALDELMRRAGVRRYGLVTPYLTDIQERILGNLRAEGYECVAERHLGLSDNFSFAEVPPETLAHLIREVAGPGPDAIVVLCTNLRGAPLAAALEREIGIPIYDSVATAIWHSLRVAQMDPGLVRGWGRLFDADPLPDVA